MEELQGNELGASVILPSYPQRVRRACERLATGLRRPQSVAQARVASGGQVRRPRRGAAHASDLGLRPLDVARGLRPPQYIPALYLWRDEPCDAARTDPARRARVVGVKQGSEKATRATRRS